MVGQRYDIVVEADQPVDNYWLRLVATTGCSNVANTTDLSAILRYEGADTSVDPTSTPTLPDNEICEDEAASNLNPVIVRNAGPFSFGSGMDITIDQTELFTNGIFQWDINGTSLVIDWDNPTLLLVDNHDPSFPSQYNVEELNGTETTVFSFFNSANCSGYTLSFNQVVYSV
jgi:Multicopper oxidase